MRASITAVLAALFAMPPAGAQVTSTARPEGPLLTRWAKNVSKTMPLPEYPRPQMVRPRWQNLNGRWQFAVGREGEAVPVGRNLSGAILVPFPMESHLSGVSGHAPRVWYRRTFHVPMPLKNNRILLHFGAVDWEATVWVNGRKQGAHRGGYAPFRFDITDALKPAGPQELIVGVFDPTDRGPQPRGKQALKPEGIWYTPVTGIWQTVWLEPVPATYISGLVLTPDVDNKALRLRVNVAGAAVEGARVRAVAMDGTQRVGEITGGANGELRLRVARPRLWSPENPHLYGLRITLEKGGRALDGVRSYFALRTIALGKDARGVTRPLLNGKFVFQVGPLDQGYWPDGIYTAPTDEALRWDIAMTKKLGFNMTRKHVKLEPARWYYWTDKLGLLVWQDMPSGNNNTPEGRRQFEAELGEMLENFHNHPSIILWVVFNEGWGQFDTERIVSAVRRADRSRLVSNASGWTDRGVGHVIDMHRYPAPGSPRPEAARAAVLGEFGGLGLRVAGHSWVREAWGYSGLMPNSQRLTRRYQQFLRGVYALRNDPGLSAAVYTQLTDVETEVNGLLTYDRAVLKADTSVVAASNRGRFPPPPTVQVIAPTARQNGVAWRYTTEAPGGDWFRPAFDDSGWKTGLAGFGQGQVGNGVIRTPWTTPDIWMRREFQWPAGATGQPYLLLHHDERAEVYINGVKAAEASGFTSDYEEIEISAAARAALRPGRNVLALHVHQTTGGQFADVGIVVLR